MTGNDKEQRMTDLPDGLSFEDGFGELDTIVRRLESGE